MGTCDDLPVKIMIAGAHRRNAIAGGCPATGLGQSGRQRRVRGETAHRRGEGGGVSGRDQKAVVAVANQKGGTARTGRHDW